MVTFVNLQHIYSTKRPSPNWFLNYLDDVDKLRAIILKHLPVMVVDDSNQKSDKSDFTSPPNPAISTVYFDNDAFEYYSDRFERKDGSEVKTF
jgi:SPX domain protein involved in polyphosphate accumulation